MSSCLLPEGLQGSLSLEAALSLGTMGLVSDSHVELPNTELVGGRTIHRSSFQISKASETQLHSVIFYFFKSSELLPIYLNYHINIDLLGLGFLLFCFLFFNRSFPMLK